MADLIPLKLQLAPFSWGLSAALVTIYVLCWAAVWSFPNLAHGWLALFSTEPPGSMGGLAIGVIVSVAAGWISGTILVSVYNGLSRP